MKPSNFISQLANPNNRRLCLYSIFPTAALLSLLFFIGNAFLAQDHKENLFRWGLWEDYAKDKCKSQCRPPGSESLPLGIVSNASNLEMRPLWGLPKEKENSSNLLSVAVGIKQKDTVDKMVGRFLSSNFVVMLFHYDGIVDGWRDLEWSDHVIHVSAANQTKWWFAKRFLHPDIVAEYDYIFLWDEDLGVEDFNPERYLKIVKGEGLEISQPALDPGKSEVHHQITARGRRSKVHRRFFKSGDAAVRCDKNSTTPPCTGWIELMAPVFSRAAWRCVWYMIQNDLIHAWGLDMQLGYCAQGDRTKNIGVVDAEYIVHYGLPTLGDEKQKALYKSHESNNRIEVRRQSYKEFKAFKGRWVKAAQNDKCWIDPYPVSVKRSRS
ncbi:uncharacterized protein LOC130760648 isoform X1 [Actinidia eriantha]|uniref:uncharacterized protein LOC130760648 isoform X1 n=1 Tax=Actinidia eriantha TaxID=165200 RepID=UPI0025889511|nr:uncharacterized protein LOC130760648 isoform X1 [Actinidia eriantha]XP_057472020.1 uncharacterized protein LOC130760648 isoform X1 [Actinidia eriantha]